MELLHQFSARVITTPRRHWPLPLHSNRDARVLLFRATTVVPCTVVTVAVAVAGCAMGVLRTAHHALRAHSHARRGERGCAVGTRGAAQPHSSRRSHAGYYGPLPARLHRWVCRVVVIGCKIRVFDITVD